MEEEYVYHVSEQNEVIGKVTRKEMRSKNLLHRVSDIFVFNSKGEILVNKRTTTKDIFPGFYSVLLGGSVSYDETYNQCAQRELAEEIGAEKVTLHFLFEYKYTNPDNKAFSRVYAVIYDGQLKLQKEEIYHAEFMSIDRLQAFMKNHNFCPEDILIFEKYLKEFHGNKQK